VAAVPERSGSGAREGREDLVRKIGFVGLGVMGKPMARNLLAAGYELAVANRSQAAVEELAREGARAAETPAAAGVGADVIITMLPDTPDVRTVACDESGFLALAPAGSLWIDMSTIDPGVAEELGRHAADRGVRFLDAPVSGGEAGAKGGTLSIMVGGDRDAFDDAMAIFETLGRTVEHVGPAGSGQSVKAANQLLVGGVIGAVSEALALVEASGVDVPAAIRVLNGGLAGNRVLQLKNESMMARDFTPGFRAELHSKDMRIALSAAAQHGVSVPLTALVAQHMAALEYTGRGGLDHTALLALVEERSRASTDRTTW
jgi:2-hydroxy-3-oxopropionate reductase